MDGRIDDRNGLECGFVLQRRSVGVVDLSTTSKNEGGLDGGEMDTPSKEWRESRVLSPNNASCFVAACFQLQRVACLSLTMIPPGWFPLRSFFRMNVFTFIRQTNPMTRAESNKVFDKSIRKGTERSRRVHTPCRGETVFVCAMFALSNPRHRQRRYVGRQRNRQKWTECWNAAKAR